MLIPAAVLQDDEAREAERKRQVELENRRRELADSDELNRIYEVNMSTAVGSHCKIFFQYMYLDF